MSRKSLVISLTTLTLLCQGTNAAANPFLPPKGKVFAGSTGGETPTGFHDQVGKHLPVFQTFTAWGYRPNLVLERSIAARTRPMIHITTNDPKRPGRDLISPRGIAKGKGDGYLVELNRVTAESKHIVYIRLMAEMNAYWNAYSAFNENGSSRGASHSTKAFREAWRRVVTIVRGGSRKAISKQLRKLGLPALTRGPDRLPRPKVAFLWVPQTRGAPNIPANSPGAYYPGGRFVDWVGTDLYSRLPYWPGVPRLYARYPRKPFVFGEYAVWDSDDADFIHRIFSFARTHKRVRMLMYNQGNDPNGPFRLKGQPRARKALKSELKSARFPAFAPEFK
jgi:hypothetical protein